MACHLKLIALSLTLLAILLLTVGISVSYFIKNYSIWDLDYSLESSGFCQPSSLPETVEGTQCLFPFVTAGKTKYDCTYYATEDYIWCATGCLPTGAATAYAKCKRTRASTIEGIDAIQKIGVRNKDLARTTRACLLLAVFTLGTVAIINVIEFYADSCVGNEAIEIAAAVLAIFAPVLILIGLAIPISRIPLVSDLGWAFWLIVSSAIIAIAAAACYIVGLQGDRVARRIYPFKMTEPIDENNIQVRHMQPIAGRTPTNLFTHPQRNAGYPSRWMRVQPTPSLGQEVHPRRNNSYQF